MTIVRDVTTAEDEHPSTMLKVGLTGGIACGKTVVRKLLADKGVFTVDADTIVHRLMGPNSELSGKIRDAFGAGILAEDDSVDRKKLGDLVFTNPDARRQLNQLVHPCVIREEKRLLAEAERIGERLAVVDAALMIETGTYREYDCLVVVFCEKRLQIQRLMERDGISRKKAEQRIEAQLPAEEKKRLADFLVDTSGSLSDTERQVEEIWRHLVASSSVD